MEVLEVAAEGKVRGETTNPETNMVLARMVIAVLETFIVWIDDDAIRILWGEQINE